eukprot:482663-Prymnesium_polylepis.1
MGSHGVTWGHMGSHGVTWGHREGGVTPKRQSGGSGQRCGEPWEGAGRALDGSLPAHRPCAHAFVRIAGGLSPERAPAMRPAFGSDRRPRYWRWRAVRQPLVRIAGGAPSQSPTRPRIGLRGLGASGPPPGAP